MGSGDYFITSTLSQDIHWALTTIYTGSILVQKWRVRNSFPLHFAFDDRLFIDVGRSTRSGNIYWYLGLLHIENIRVEYIQKNEPTGLAIRTKNSAYDGALYYTYYIDSTSSNHLYRQEIDSSFNFTSDLVYTSIGNNCGSEIVVTSSLVAISCPSSSSTSSTITVLSESDLSLIHTQSTTSSAFSLGQTLHLLSHSNYVNFIFDL